MGYCEHCGNELPPKTWYTRYCTKCGAAVPGQMSGNKNAQPPIPDEVAHMSLPDRVAAAGVTPGFSTRVNTDEFKRAKGKGNRTFVVTLIVIGIVLAPLVTFIAGLINPQDIGLMIGACLLVELIVIVVLIVQLAKRFGGKTWDGQVTDKRIVRKRSGNSSVRTPSHIIYFITDDGKKKRFDERMRHDFYDYLQVGDRVRFHPQLTFPIEKYDKTTSALLVCNFCGCSQNIEQDYCGACGKPLLK